MPTETFFNLPKEKQQRILKAAALEFSQAGLNEASIAKVIRTADISRGSFYQYFRDKEDLYYYYFQTLKRSGHRYLIQTIEDNHGDLFAGVEDYFLRLLPEVFEGENRSFFRHLFLNMDSHGFQRVIPCLEKKEGHHAAFHSHEREKNQQELVRVVNQASLNVQNDDELILLFKLLMHLLFSTIAEGCRQQEESANVSLDTMKEHFALKIQWLKKGARKENEHD